MAEIKDEVFTNFARELVAKLTEVVKNIDIESIDLYKLGYEKGRAEEREKILNCLPKCCNAEYKCRLSKDDCFECMYQTLDKIEEQLKGNEEYGR